MLLLTKLAPFRALTQFLSQPSLCVTYIWALAELGESVTIGWFEICLSQKRDAERLQLPRVIHWNELFCTEKNINDKKKYEKWVFLMVVVFVMQNFSLYSISIHFKKILWKSSFNPCKKRLWIFFIENFIVCSSITYFAYH